MSITPIKHTILRQELHPIGPITNLGATVESGTVEAFALGTFGARSIRSRPATSASRGAYSA